MFGSKIDQIAMVRPDFKIVFTSFKVVAEDFKGTDNCKEFVIMNFVVALSRLQGLGVVSDRVPMVQSIRLFKDSAHSEITGVCD